MYGARLVLNLPGLVEQTVNVKVEQSCDGVHNNFLRISKWKANIVNLWHRMFKLT